MIDHIVFNRLEETYYFGEKIQIIIGNIITLETVQTQFYSIPPNSYGLTEEPARHEIFVVPIRKARIPLVHQEICSLLMTWIFTYSWRLKRGGNSSHFGIILI